MHNENIEAIPARDHDEVEREAIVAADDTGMVSQQEILVEYETREAEE